MKTLVKTKIVVNEQEGSVVAYFWKRTFLCFGYWYRYVSSGPGRMSDQDIQKINDDAVARIFFDQYMRECRYPGKRNG